MQYAWQHDADSKPFHQACALPALSAPARFQRCASHCDLCCWTECTFIILDKSQVADHASLESAANVPGTA